MSADTRAPVSVCVIARNEQANIEKCLQSVRPFVREIVVVDTGSDDDTPALAAKYADKFERFTDCNDAEGRIADFSLARNRSFALATQPWALWVDGDDVLEGADKLAEIVAAHDHLPRCCVMWNYDYDHDGQGNVTMKFIRERLVKPPRDFMWVSPVHETLVPQNGDTAKVLVPEGIRNVHRRRDIAKVVESGRNLRILQTHYNKVGESDVRSLYYLGLELGWTGNPGMSIDMHKRYVALSGWPDEKCLAMLEIARHCQALGRYEEAVEWGHKAMDVKPTWGEPFFSLCKSYYFVAQKTGAREDWERAATFGRRFLDSPPAQTVLFINPMERVEVHRFLVVALMQLGDVAGAEASCNAILEKLPGDPNSAFNLKICRERILKGDIQAKANELRARDLIDDNGIRLINAALDGKFKVRDAAAGEAAKAADPTPGGITIRRSGLDIVLFIGPGAEKWTPDSIKQTGIGGSERMAWEMSKRLVQLGNRVRVYADCDAAATYEGVEWFPHTDYRNLICDVLITSRRPSALDDQFNVRARTTFCWVHDVHCGTELNYMRALRVDRFLCLSAWHRDFFLNHYPFVHPSQVLQTRNGIDLSLYEKPEERNPRRMFYSSSLDRGVFTALEAMPEIRKRVPDAEFHIYYGLDVWKRFASPEQMKLIQTLEQLMELRKADGVTFHGRVSPEELAREQKKSGLQAYPTWFCCHGDTRISVPGDHRGGAPTVRIADMVGKSGFPVYAFNEEENRFEIRTCTKVWETKIAEELVDIELDSGQHLKVTPDHKVLTFDGDWVEAGTLKGGDSLRALHYRYNVAIRDANGRWTNEYRLVGEWKEGRRLRSDEHVDHSDPERLDNRPEALAVMTAAAHFSKTHKGKKLSRKHVEKKRAAAMAAVAAMSPERKKAWHAAGIKALWARVNGMGLAEREAWLAKRRATKRATLLSRKALPLPYEAREGHNHKVVRVTRITEPTPVYDMEVEGLHNFIAEGVVIHNCETSCLSAMEAQAAGCRIVTSPIAALNETVGPRGTMIPGDWLSPDYKQRFVDACVTAMLKPEDGERDALKAYARENFGLDSLARDWQTLLYRVLGEVAASPIVPYKTKYQRAA